MKVVKEVFRAGKWTDSAGSTRKWSTKDIDGWISRFNPDKSETKAGRKVPLTVGHPDDNDPAFGWVSKLWRDGKKLFAEFTDVSDQMVEWIRNKTYRQVSIALNNSGDLRHIGILGGVPPAVPGLSEWQFADGDYTEYTFSDEKRLTTAMKAARDWFFSSSETDDDKSIQKVFNQLNQNKEETMENEKLAAELATANTKLAELESKFNEAETEAKNLKEKFAAEQKAHSELIAQVKIDTEKSLDAADTAFCDKLIEDKKLLPADKDTTLANLKALRTPGDIKFSDGQNELSPVDACKKILESKPELEVEHKFSDGASRENDDRLVTLSREYAKNHKCSYNEAAKEVLALHPELEKL